jgi:hypothetical protein
MDPPGEPGSTFSFWKRLATAMGEVTNPTGKVAMKVGVREAMTDGLVRIAHGWWKPEMQQGLDHSSGALARADAQLCPDDEDDLDRFVRLRDEDDFMRDDWIDSDMEVRSRRAGPLPARRPGRPDRRLAPTIGSDQEFAALERRPRRFSSDSAQIQGQPTT